MSCIGRAHLVGPGGRVLARKCVGVGVGVQVLKQRFSAGQGNGEARGASVGVSFILS